MRINIPKPCSANWEEMKVGLVSRHCETCVKNVIDFRGKAKEDILLYLLSNTQENICGRFTRNQLDQVELEHLINIKTLRKLPRNRAFLILTLAALALASCQTPPPDSANSTLKTKQPVEQELDTATVEHADNQSNQDSIEACTASPKPPKDPIEIELTGEVAIMGDVIVEPYFEDTVWVEGPDTLEPVPRKEKEERVFNIVEEMPEFPGGLDSLFAFVNKHITYPKDAKDADIEGKVYVQFTVEPTGELSNVEIIRGLGFESINQEVMRVMQLMPVWKPGKQRQKAVRTRYALPIQFSLD